MGLVVFSLLYSISGQLLRGHSPLLRVVQLGLSRDPEEFPEREDFLAVFTLSKLPNILSKAVLDNRKSKELTD